MLTLSLSLSQESHSQQRGKARNQMRKIPFNCLEPMKTSETIFLPNHKWNESFKIHSCVALFKDFQRVRILCGNRFYASFFFISSIQRRTYPLHDQPSTPCSQKVTHRFHQIHILIQHSKLTTFYSNFLTHMTCPF